MSGSLHPVPLMLVCSPGGHLLDMALLAAGLPDHERLWVTLDSADSRTLLRDQSVVFAHGPTNRSLVNLIRNAFLATRVLRRSRPRVVVTTGAGVGVPFAWLARLSGATVLYVECTGRVDGLSLSARFIAPVARAVIVPWPEQARAGRRTVYAGGNPLVGAALNGFVPTVAAGERRGVFATVGSSRTPFDRFLRLIDGVRPEEPMTVQSGPSRIRPAGARCVPFMSFDDLVLEISRARAVVMHAGVGSTMLALATGVRPILVPRRRTQGEAVDDHQLAFARRLARAGLAHVAETHGEIVAALEADQPEEVRLGDGDGGGTSRLLRRLVDEVLV